MTTLDLVNKLLSLGTIGSQVFLLLAIIFLLFFRKQKNNIAEFIGQHGLVLAFITALVATLGSLFYSGGAGFEPCPLCWWQRIFMYPLVVLFAIALIKKDSRIIHYALALSLMGGAVSLYHNAVYYSNGGLTLPCQALGNGVSCIKRYVFEFGYVTIPVMALTAFALIIVLLIWVKLQKADNNNA